VIAGYICRLVSNIDPGQGTRQLTTCFLLIIGLISCTGNAVFNEKISSLDGYSFHGRAKITGSSDAGQIYVWLESFNIGTWTDNTGYFELQLPPASTQSGGGLTGEFKLFYYIANYGLEISRIYIEKGRLQYGKLSLEEGGSIRDLITLTQMLEITTHTDTVIYSEFSGHIPIVVTLKNLIDTVDIEYLSIYENSFDGLFFLADTAQLDQAIPISYSQIKKQHEILKPTELIMTLWVSEYLFEPGNYYMIPYLYIKQKDLPQPLLETISGEYDAFSTDYLKLPFRRNNGVLKILKEKPNIYD
jgi:hypothetical protein